MTLADIRDFAKRIYGPASSRSIDPVLWNDFINEGLEIFCNNTGCLDDIKELALVNGAVSASTTVAVDSPGSKYLSEGDVLDFLDGTTNDEAGATVATITSATSIELSAAATISDNAKIYYQNAHGYITIVADQVEYTIPEGVVLRQDSDQPFELFFCEDSSSELQLRFSSPERLRDERGSAWRSREGVPSHFYLRGTDKFGLYPVYNSGLTNGLRAKWAREARPLLDDDDVPEIRKQYHRGLGYFAAARAAEISERDDKTVGRLMQGFTMHHAKLNEAISAWRNQGRLAGALS